MSTSPDDTAAIRAAFDASNKTQLTPEELRAKKLETVRALLAKAEGAGTPEEADVFRAKADAIMMQFAIDQWMVEEAQAGVYARPKPEIRSFSFEWWYRSSHRNALWSIFCEVATHCRCVIAHRGQGKAIEGKPGNFYAMPVIGLPSDLDYFDMLFTHLMLQMGMQLEPKPDPSKSFEENAYIMRISGTNKLRVAKLIHEAGLTPADITPDTEGGREFPGYTNAWDKTYSPQTKKLLRKLRAASEKYAKDNDLSTTVVGTGTTGTTVWQRSFARGFASEIGDRLYAMRRAENKPSEGPSVAIALRDIRQVAVDLYNETWPDLCHGCGKLIINCECICPKCKKLLRTECECPGRSRGLSRTVAYDHRAISAGRQAGQKADISGHQGRRVGGRKELER
jgi:Protein of unknown function (DUF2786)